MVTKTNAVMQYAGLDGNAFSIMGAARTAMRRAGVEKSVMDQYIKEAMSGDYDNLLCVTMQYVGDIDD